MDYKQEIENAYRKHTQDLESFTDKDPIGFITLRGESYINLVNALQVIHKNAIVEHPEIDSELVQLSEYYTNKFKEDYQ